MADQGVPLRPRFALWLTLFPRTRKCPWLDPPYRARSKGVVEKVLSYPTRSGMSRDGCTEFVNAADELKSVAAAGVDQPSLMTFDAHLGRDVQRAAVEFPNCSCGAPMSALLLALSHPFDAGRYLDCLGRQPTGTPGNRELWRDSRLRQSFGTRKRDPALSAKIPRACPKRCLSPALPTRFPEQPGYRRVPVCAPNHPDCRDGAPSLAAVCRTHSCPRRTDLSRH